MKNAIISLTKMSTAHHIKTSFARKAAVAFLQSSPKNSVAKIVVPDNRNFKHAGLCVGKQPNNMVSSSLQLLLVISITVESTLRTTNTIFASSFVPIVLFPKKTQQGLINSNKDTTHPAMSSPQTRKAKLRTAADVISRLQWDPMYSTVGSEDDDANKDIMIGYTDRIHGPMEKSIHDFCLGGDIPEHRIQYFRSTATNGPESILWDRVARMDRIFGSGNTISANTSCATTTWANIRQAQATMERLAEERRERRADKLRRHEKRQAAAALRLQKLHEQQSGRPKQHRDALEQRHVWRSVPMASSTGATGTPRRTARIQVVTWNVLFDIYETEPSHDRWLQSIATLQHIQADIVALQEVTPSYAELLLEQSWVQNDYTTSLVSPSDDEHDFSSITPYGNLLLWRRDMFHLRSVHYCTDGHRHRAVLASLDHRCDNNRNVTSNGEPTSNVLLFANIHLPADKSLVSQAPSTCESELPTHAERSLARRRELASVLAKLQVLEEEEAAANTTCLIAGDLNIVQEDEVMDGFFSAPPTTHAPAQAFFADAWLECKSNHAASSNNLTCTDDDDGFTYDTIRNSRAAKVSKRPPRRLDRILYGHCWSTTTTISILPVARSLIMGHPNVEATTKHEAEQPYPEVDAHPPSDHYGVAIEFEWNKNPQRQSSSSPGRKSIDLKQQQQHYATATAWSSCSPLTQDTLVALLLDPEEHDHTLYDPHSSLPHPHITLLHGFVELSNLESRHHAVATIRKVIDNATPAPVVKLAPSLHVLEHPASATLIAEPDNMAWLQRLYSGLVAAFPQCRGQESRSADGLWRPHGAYTGGERRL